MKILACLLSLSVGVSVGHGQWLETTIVLPDTLGWLDHPWSLGYNTLNNRVYVGCDSGVLVIDGATNQRLACIKTGGRMFAFCYNPQSNKVYSASQRDSSVTVIDCVRDVVVATLRAGQDPQALCYNSIDNKVYCASHWTGDVTVIDGAGDSVITTVPGIALAVALSYDPEYNKVYCAGGYDGGGNTVTVIDGATDSVVATITVGAGPRGFCMNPAQDRVYVANSSSSSISVIHTSPPGIEESFRLAVPNSKPAATVVRGVLFLPRSTSQSASTSLLDVSGREVMTLRLGENDVRALCPGVYFVKFTSRAGTRKVIIAR